MFKNLQGGENVAKQEKDKKNKFFIFANKIWLFIKTLPQLLADTFMWLSLSYVSILINIILIMGINSIDFLSASKRLDILSCIFTTNVCFLVGIIYNMYITDYKKRKYVFGFTIFTAIVSTVLSVLVIIKTETSFHFDMNIVYFCVIGVLVLSVLFALISKYDEKNAMIQDLAKQSRGIQTVNIDGKDFKV